MRHHETFRGYPSLRPLVPVPDVDDDEIDAADEIVQEFFAAVDFSFEEDVLTYYSPSHSPTEEVPPSQVFHIYHVDRVLFNAQENADHPPGQPQEDSDDYEDQLIYALDALEEDEGEQRAVHDQLLDDDEEDILDLRLLQLEPQPCHSRDPVSLFSDLEGKVLVPNSPIPSEYGSPPHLSPFWRSEPLEPYPLSVPGSRIMPNIIDDFALDHGPMEIEDPEPELRLETVPEPQEPEPLPSTSRGSRGIWSTGLALGVDGSGKMTGLSIDSARGPTDAAKNPGRGSGRKRINISRASSSAGLSNNLFKKKSSPENTDSNDSPKRLGAGAPRYDLKKSKRESRSTNKKRSCNSEEQRDAGKMEEENIDNPMRPTYPGGKGNCFKKFSSIPGVLEWFKNQEQEIEEEMDCEESDELKYRAWESTRSKRKARSEPVSVERKRYDWEDAMDSLDGCSEEEQEDEELEEEEEDERPLRRGRGRPRKKY